MPPSCRCVPVTIRFSGRDFVGKGLPTYATPIYRAEALVQIRQESRTGGGLNALAAQFGGLVDFAGLSCSCKVPPRPAAKGLLYIRELRI